MPHYWWVVAGLESRIEEETALTWTVVDHRLVDNFSQYCQKMVVKLVSWVSTRTTFAPDTLSKSITSKQSL